MDDTDLGLEDVDADLVERVMSGALELEIQNPWSIGASFSLTIRSPTVNITKDFTLAAEGTSTARVEFSQAELRSILGQPNVVLGGYGFVDPSAGSVTLTPDQVLILNSKLDLVVRLGGGGSGS
jgi:hypothetical protein